LSFSSDNFFRFAGISATSAVHSVLTFSEDMQFLLSSTTAAQLLSSTTRWVVSHFNTLGAWRTLVGRLSTLRRFDSESAPVLDEQRGRVGLATVTIGGDSSLFDAGDSSFENSFICTNMFEGSLLRGGECKFATASLPFLEVREIEDDGADKADLPCALRPA